MCHLVMLVGIRSGTAISDGYTVDHMNIHVIGIMTDRRQG